MCLEHNDYPAPFCVTDDYGNSVRWAGKELVWVDAHQTAERSKVQRKAGKLSYVCLSCGAESHQPKFNKSCNYFLARESGGWHGKKLILSE